MRSTPLVFLSLLWVGACDSPLESDEQRRVGVISFYGDPVVIDLPDTLYASFSFDVTIRTYAGGCDRQGPTHTGGKRGVIVDITPYDMFYTGGGPCPSILKTFDHSVNIVVMEPGVVEFRFHGRALPEDSSLTVVREVLVR